MPPGHPGSLPDTPPGRAGSLPDTPPGRPTWRAAASRARPDTAARAGHPGSVDLETPSVSPWTARRGRVDFGGYFLRPSGGPYQDGRAMVSDLNSQTKAAAPSSTLTTDQRGAGVKRPQQRWRRPGHGGRRERPRPGRLLRPGGWRGRGPADPRRSADNPATQSRPAQGVAGAMAGRPCYSPWG